jgi:Zn-dependent M28 family amino/carboxypeptidase
VRRLVLLVALVSCSRPGLDEARVASLPPVVEGIERGRLMARVNELVAAHRAEAQTPFDCSVFERTEIDETRRPVCNLTRHNARAYVKAAFEELGLPVRLHDTAHEQFDTQNVVAELRGQNRPDEVLMVGAHFDAFYAGADDNSSGVAAMLEIARALSGRRFARTIRFIGFDLEEFGLVGSTRYAASQEAEKLVTTLVFDCIGYASSEEGSQAPILGMPVPSVGDFVGIIANEASAKEAMDLRALAKRFGFVKTEAVVAPADGAFPQTRDLMRSDHAPFWLRGGTAVFLTDTANFRNEAYHTDRDTADDLDPAFLEGVARLAGAALAYWAEELR